MQDPQPVGTWTAFPENVCLHPNFARRIKDVRLTIASNFLKILNFIFVFILDLL